MRKEATCCARPHQASGPISFITVVAYKDGYQPASREGFPGYNIINLEIVRR